MPKWSKSSENTLKKMAKKSATTSRIAFKVGRSKGAVRAKASRMKISLKPRD
jgi:hypothetical protein